MKKRKQMALLEEKMYDVAMNFNAKLLELRELKHRLMEQIHEDNAQLKVLDAELAALATYSKSIQADASTRLFEPQMDLREWPEQRERVSDNQIEEYEAKGIVRSVLSLPGDNDTLATKAEPPIHPTLTLHNVVALMPGYELSPLEEEELRIRVIELRRQREALKDKVVHAIDTFDDAIYRLRREKLKLDIALKKGEIKLMIRLGELVLLEQFENKENLLVSKLEKCKTDKAQVVRELMDCSDQFAAKRKEMEESQRNESAVQSEFVALVGASHPCFAVLQKIFKKRLKRQKKRSSDDDDDDDDESDDEYNSNDDDDDDDNDSNEEEMCPSGCEMALYEKVLALREKKADMDDAMSDINKAIDDLKRSNDRQIQKQRQIDKELTATEQDIQAFQTEKQMRFNQLDVIVALSKEQLRCMQPKDAESDGRSSVLGVTKSALYLPESVENALVFNQSVVHRLSQRILTLQDENKSLRQVFRDLHKQQNQLQRDKTRQNELIGDIQDKCNQLERLKFGRLIDIDLLDKACDTGSLMELETKVRTKEIHGQKQVADAKGEQQRLKMEILKATEENTRLLSEIAVLSERQFSLEKELNQADIHNTLEDDSAHLEREMHERKKLVELVKLQSREIEALKQEVNMLRGKKGRVHASVSSMLR
ncbi:Cilia- and flagella-associated protein 44 [Aphanomyces cochlioides]|nr:Cilia- and flagella-associated protein 44 [Aphanomyces cochlioides]